MPIYFAKTDEEFNSMIQTLEDKRAGGEVRFLGKTRIFSHEKEVSFLHFESHVELAKVLFAELESEAKRRFSILESFAVHRLGKVEVGQSSVLIGVSAPHRDEAFKAARFLIDELKSKLPIWKKEVFADGEARFVICESHKKIGLKAVQKALEAKGFNQISQKKVLLIGAGGLGCPLAVNLSSLCSLTIYDGDAVEPSNLARQFVYSHNDIGQNKAWTLKNFLGERISHHVEAFERYLRKEEAGCLLKNFDLVIDGSDCAATKSMLKSQAFEQKVPLISASVWRSVGDVQIYLPTKESLCLNCFSPPPFLGGSCSEVGVFTHTCAAVAAFVCEQALTIFGGHLLQSKIWIFDGGFKEIAISKDDQCQTCTPFKKKLVRIK